MEGKMVFAVYRKGRRNMSFTMEKDGHELEMSDDRVWGIEIDELRCPRKSQLDAIKHHFKHHDRMYVFDFNTLMDENRSEFTTNGEEVSE